LHSRGQNETEKPKNEIEKEQSIREVRRKPRECRMVESREEKSNSEEVFNIKLFKSNQVG